MATKSARKSTNCATKWSERKSKASALPKRCALRVSDLSLLSFSSTRQAVKHPARALEFREALLFLAEPPRVRHQTAARAPRGMLHVQHLVKQNVFHGELRHARPVHPAFQPKVNSSGTLPAPLHPPPPA